MLAKVKKRYEHLQRRRKDKELQAQIKNSRPRYCRCGPLCWIIMGFKSVLGEKVNSARLTRCTILN